MTSVAVGAAAWTSLRSFKNTQKKETAVPAGRKEAIERQTEHTIHNADGTIGQKNSYGNDPPERKG